VELRLRVFENRVLRRIFGPMRHKVAEEWRKLHNEQLHDLYSSPNIVRVIKSRIMIWAGHVARMRREEACTWFSLENLRKRDPSCRWEDNIKMDLQEVVCGSMDWIRLAQDRDRWRVLVNVIMNLRVP
jgi:hypothetical protein